MNRAQILWMQCWIALTGAVLWYLPPAPANSSYVVSLSLAWALLCLVAIWVEGLETWAHRLSAFFGFLLCTIEGILGLLGLTDRPVLLLVMALLHGCTFFLSVVGRYLSRTRTRRRPSLDVLAAQALEEIRREAESEKNEADGSSL